MNKKVKIAVIGTTAVLALGTAVWFGSKKLQKTTVNVYALTELSQQIWGETASLEGSVSSHVSQEVKLLDNQIVSKIHVQEGQEVKEGDPLLSYDMTLVDIDLEMEKLNKQQLEIKKKGLEQDLKKLKKDKSSLASSVGEYEFDYLLGENNLWKAVEITAEKEAASPNGSEALTAPEGGGELTPPEEPGTTLPEKPGVTLPEESGTTPPAEEPGVTSPGEPGITPPPGGTGEPGTTLPSENPGETPPPGETEEQDPTPPSGENQEIPMPSGVYKRLYGDVTINTAVFHDDDAIIENAVPYKGKGTKEEPFVFLCTKGVLIQGAFLNKIAGFGTTEGIRNESVSCVLEVRSDNSRDGILLAAMRLEGSDLKSIAKPNAWFRTGLGKNELETMFPDNQKPEGEELSDLPDGAGDLFTDDQIIGGYSREELEKAIGEKEREIVTAGLDIREADLRIKKVEQQLQDETVCSTINGVVKRVGDPAKGEIDGEPFIVVESSGGVYVQGRVSEDMLGKIQPGQMLSGMAYESGMPFDAEVKEVSPYPVSDYYMYSDRELSYYPFTAFIQNSEGLKDHEMVSMNMPQEDGAITGIFVSKEYVRSKDGEDFVYKEGKNGRLEKQIVKTGRTFYGYLVEIKEGITMEDYLAFPYGKKVKGGVKVKRSTLSELYNMY